MRRTPLTSLLLAAPFALACAPFASPSPASTVEAETAVSGLWDWCPTPEPITEVNRDALWLQANESAVYCAATPPGRYDVDEEDLLAVLEEKTQLRLVPADTFLSLDAGDHEADIPLCARSNGDQSPTVRDAGVLKVVHTDQIGRTRVDLTFEQVLRDPFGNARTVHVSIDGYEDRLQNGVLLDGRDWPAGADPRVRMSLCEGEGCVPDEDGLLYARPLRSCEAPEAAEEIHRLTFDRGEIVVRAKNPSSPWSFQGTLTEIAGELDGETFSQTSYWKTLVRLSYPYSSERDYLVLFDAPVGDACGIEVRRAYPSTYASNTTVSVIDCTGELETRQVFGNDFERIELDTEE
jgi:hypothetical protein